MEENIYPAASPELKQMRQALSPEMNDSFAAFSSSVFKAGALDARTKQLIAVAAAHVTQCPYCIRGHTKQALRAGATREQVMEAIWVAAEMRAGAAFAHSNLALDVMNEHGG
jgi:AhpD family alkylhydroperoxidase